MTWIERLLARFGYVPEGRLDEAVRNLGAALAEADRERHRRAKAEDALVLERAARPAGVVLSTRDQVAVARAHLDAVRARAERLVA